MLFEAMLFLVSLLSGVISSISGFGIGSFVTPVLAISVGTGIAVAAVSFIHFFGTLLRFFFWRKHINWHILLSFGITSAAGGLIGALLHNVLFNSILNIIFGCLLVFAGFTGFTGLSDKVHLKGALAWCAGALSGFFGGLVGNQGGIRSAAMFGFKLDRKEFIATATGIALAVDMVRMPVYAFTQAKDLMAIWPFMLIGILAVCIGTLVGGRLLARIPEDLFKRIVCFLIFFVGIFMLIRG